MRNARSIFGKRVYFLGSRTRYPLLVLRVLTPLAMLLGFLESLNPYQPGQAATYAFLLVLLALTEIVVFLAPLPRLVIGRQQIEYYDWGCSIRSPWMNLEAVYKHFGEDKLKLRQPELQPRHLLARLGENVDEGGRYIPLSRFAQNWKETELGDNLRQFAPHLFEPTSVAANSQ